MRQTCLIVSACWLSVMAGTWAGDPQWSHLDPIPVIPPVVVGDPVAVPETIGATLLAGVGFFMLFRRRRYQ